MDIYVENYLINIVKLLKSRIFIYLTSYNLDLVWYMG